MYLPIFTKVKVELCRFELAKCLPTKEDLILSLQATGRVTCIQMARAAGPDTECGPVVINTESSKCSYLLQLLKA